MVDTRSFPGNKNEALTEALGIDVGGSNIKAAPVNLLMGELAAKPVKLETPESASPADVSDLLRNLVTRFSWTGPIGVGYPGVVKGGVTYSAAHVSNEWVGYSAEAALRELTGSVVRVINDADAAGLAEMRFGAGREHDSPDGGTVLVLTFGTGIGSALFTNGRLLPNTEFGHMDMGGFEAEQLAAAKVRLSEDLDWSEWCQRINRFLAEMERLLSPDLIIFGGGVTENFDKFGHLLQTRAKLSPAQMRNEAGIVGAALAVVRS
jgi:polyphosphate glucokinase